jgi:hypothetical protein
VEKLGGFGHDDQLAHETFVLALDISCMLASSWQRVGERLLGVTVVKLLQVLVGDGHCRLGKCAEFIHDLKQEKESNKIAYLQGGQHAQI